MTTTGTVDPDHLTRFMERSERHMKEVTEALATLNQKYDRLSTRVQRLEFEFSKCRANGGGAPPPPPPPHAMDNNYGTWNNHEPRRNDNAEHTIIPATNPVEDTYHLLDEILPHHSLESIVKKKLPDLVDRDNTEQTLWDGRSDLKITLVCVVPSVIISQSSNADAVDFVVLKHRWRWKQVEEEEDAETAEVLGISVATLAG
jgi:hypothetical protein